MGYSPWGREDLDMTEVTENTHDIKVKRRNVTFEERLRKCGSGSCCHLGEWPFGQEKQQAYA